VFIIYGEHVESPLAQTGHVAQEVAGDQRQLPLFIAIYGGFGGFEVTLRPSFHLDKTQDVPIPADEIELAAMIGGAVVARDDRVAAPAKVKISVLLAAPAGTLVRWHVLGRKRSCCQPVQCAQCGLRQASGEHEKLHLHPSSNHTAPYVIRVTARPVQFAAGALLIAGGPLSATSVHGKPVEASDLLVSDVTVLAAEAGRATQAELSNLLRI